MERQDAAMTILQDHVIVAVFAETDSPLIGLRNLVMPIRASNIHYKDLIHVVIVGNVDYLKSKLERICSEYTSTPFSTVILFLSRLSKISE